MINGLMLQSFFGKIASQTSPNEGQEHHAVQGLIESGDFTIDLNSRMVTLQGEDLDLSSEEFDVLLFLIRHPQRLITPHTVLATSPAAENARHTEFLRVLLSLRKKLEAAGDSQHYLRTEPWVVYRFDPDPFCPKQ